MFSKSQLESISKHLHSLATIFEAASKSNNTETGKSKRGRKPGAVADTIRCTGEIAKGDRCKNKAINNGFCGKHTKTE